jgi:hypothetical protein
LTRPVAHPEAAIRSIIRLAAPAVFDRRLAGAATPSVKTRAGSGFSHLSSPNQSHHHWCSNDASAAVADRMSQYRDRQRGLDEKSVVASVRASAQPTVTAGTSASTRKARRPSHPVNTGAAAAATKCASTRTSTQPSSDAYVDRRHLSPTSRRGYPDIDRENRYRRIRSTPVRPVPGRSESEQLSEIAGPAQDRGAASSGGHRGQPEPAEPGPDTPS